MAKPIVSTRRVLGPFRAAGLVIAVTASCGLLYRGDEASRAAEAAPAEAADQRSGSSPEELYSRVAPSVVTIIVKDEDGASIGSGSGFFVDERELPRDRLCAAHDEDAAAEFPTVLPDDRDDEPDDAPSDSALDFPIDLDSPAPAATRVVYVLTNYHVIRTAAAANVYLFGGGVGAVESVVAEDEDVDLALLRVAVPANAAAPGIRLAAEDPRVFTTVYAIGSPRGLAGTASAGHVSGYPNLGRNHRWLQTTAPISPGSSGGPLLLADATVAGVTTMCLLESQNLNFAIPASKIREFLANATVDFRDLAQGRCLAWEEERAFREMQRAVKLPDSWLTEVNAAAKLAEAREELLGGIGRREANRLERAIELAKEVEYSLPADFEHLAHYIIGKASILLAERDVPEPAKGGVRTEAHHIRYRASQHAQTAEYRLAQATSLAPDFAPAHERLARHHANCGNWAEALLAADEVVRLMPRSSGALALRAECYRELHQPDAARDDLTEAVELSPRDAKLHCELAKVLSDLGEYDEAVESFTAALAFDAANFRDAIYYHRGIAYRNAGNAHKASADFTAARALGWPAEECDAALAACGQQHAGETFPINARLFDDGNKRTERADAAQTTVYVTKTGKKYHRDGCRHLSHSKIPMPLDQAARTYGPCSHCRPPTP